MQDDVDFAATVTGGLVLVTGEIDLATAPRLRAALAKAVASGEPLVVDLSGVGYLDSAAMAALYQHAEAGLELVVAEGSVVERALDIGGLLGQVSVRRPAAPLAKP